FGVEREAAMAVDGLFATRPVEFPVGRPEEAEGMFDVLTYQKGGSVLRMLEQFIGADAFRRGVSDYLTTHAHGNTETADLWDALERSSGRDIRGIMGTFIDQGGYPLVRVDEQGSLSQAPFSYRGRPGGAIGSHWQVPVLLRSLGIDADGTSGPAPDPEPVLLDRPTAEAAGRGVGLVNAGGSGYYRVAYPSAVLTRLSSALGQLAPLERYNLVSDTWAAVLSGDGELGDFLHLAESLVATGEDDPSVWSVVTGAVWLTDRVVATGDRMVLTQAVRHLFTPLFERLTFDPRPDDGERTPALRASVIRTLGIIGDDPSVRAEAAARFARSDATPLDPDIASAVLDVVADGGGTEEYGMFVARHLKPANPQEENRYLYALASFTDSELAAQTFDFALSEVRTQNAPFLIQLLLANRVVGVETWPRLRDAWDTITGRFPSNIVPRMLDGVRGLCSPPSLADEVTGFLETHPLVAGGRMVEQTLERLAVNVDFGRREGSGLAATLTKALSLTTEPGGPR
ncbi:MAG: M1 family metallopeptidase, partial [Acidimicrobiales bacterium]